MKRKRRLCKSGNYDGKEGSSGMADGHRVKDGTTMEKLLALFFIHCSLFSSYDLMSAFAMALVQKQRFKCTLHFWKKGDAITIFGLKPKHAKLNSYFKQIKLAA